MKTHRFTLQTYITQVLTVLALMLKAASVQAQSVTVTAKRVFQTTGQGNTAAPILRLKITNNTDTDAVLLHADIAATDAARRNSRSLALYTTPTIEYYATRQPMMLGTVNTKQLGTHMPPADIGIPADMQYHLMAVRYGGYRLPKGISYLWLTADIKPNATLGEYVDATVLQLRMRTSNGEVVVKPDMRHTQYAVPGLRIYRTQTFPYGPTTDKCRFYRIPGMTLNADGDIVITADRRYNSQADLGNHKIDVSLRRSHDGGRTWTPQQLIAIGDSATTDGFGYGDASLVRAKSGRLLCLSIGSKYWSFDGQGGLTLTTSDDGGRTWSPVRNLRRKNFTDATHNLVDSIGFFSLFCASGRSLCTADGTIMAVAACLDKKGDRTFSDYLLSSTDEGETWTLGPACAYHQGDEAKLVQMNDGSLLISSRKTKGNRGFNRGSSDGRQWQQQYDDPHMPANACNADILYYSRSTQRQPDIMLHTGIITHDRHGLRLWMSIDEGHTWHPVTDIQQGGAAYSTMERLPNGDLAILYEDDSYNAGNGYYINFVTLTRQQILGWYEQLRAQGSN